MKLYLICMSGRNMRFTQLRDCYRGMAKELNGEVVMSLAKGSYSLYIEKAKELKKR